MASTPSSLPRAAPSRWPRVLRRAAHGAGLLLVLAGAVFAWREIPRLSFFFVRRLEVQGVRFVSPDSLVRTLRIPYGRSLLAPLDSIVLQAKTVPGVASAVARRRWPGAIELTVVETVPVAWAPGPRGVLALVDESARPLPFDPRGQRVRLPLAPADTQVTRALGRILALDAAWFGQIEQVQLQPDSTLDVRLPEGRIRLPLAPTEQTFRDLRVVMTALAQRNEAWQRIDAVHAPRFFVQGATRRAAGPDTSAAMAAPMDSLVDLTDIPVLPDSADAP